MDSNTAVPKKLTRPKTYMTEETRREAVREAKRKYAKKKRGGSISAKDLKGLHSSSYKEDPDRQVGEWVLDESISKPTARVYYNASKGQAIVVHRGTEATVKDWANNAFFVAGLSPLTQRYKDSEAVQKASEEKYPDVLTTGHSQGSVYSKIAKDQKKVVDVNPASFFQSTEGTTVRSATDPVSALRGISNLFSSSKKNITTSAQLNPLKSHSIDILSELPPDQELGGSLTKHLKGIFMKGKGNAFESFFKKTLPSGLIHTGIPILGSVAGSTLVAGPISGFVGSQVGEKAGEMLADDIGKKTGLGLNTKRLKQLGR